MNSIDRLLLERELSRLAFHVKGIADAMDRMKAEGGDPQLIEIALGALYYMHIIGHEQRHPDFARQLDDVALKVAKFTLKSIKEG